MIDRQNPAWRTRLTQLGLTAALLAGGLGAARALHADELFLQGGVIEGRVLDETRDAVKIETPSGVLLVPKSAITRQVPGVSRLERYAVQRGTGMLTASRHVELAEWCQGEGLQRLATQHLEEALSVDPTLPEALQAAGYVRLGQLWLYTGAPASKDDQAAVRAELMVQTLITGWFRRVRGIQQNYFRDDDPDRPAHVGRQYLAALDAPLAIPAACRALGDADADQRIALTQLLGESAGQDEALLNLLLLSVFDADAQVRRAAALELGRAGDERCVALLQAALRSEVEVLVRRSAEVLGVLRAESAIEDLIAALVPPDPGPGVLTAQAWLDQAEAELATPMLIPLDDEPVQRAPRIDLPQFDRTLDALTSTDRQPLGGLRSEVQDALILITDENFGFDQQAWREWLQQRGD